MAEHIQVPLKNLRFGHEAPNHPGNARITGREDDIATLAAHIHVRGKIDDLLIYDDGVPDVYFVSNGNRSLAALRMIYGVESEELIDCKLTTADRAYEDSLAVAVLAKKFHPVDEYEGFAKLRDDLGKTEEEIAREYGKTQREVKQVLALGRLSPKIRDAWRKGEIKAEVAKAFTLGLDHSTQDKVFDKLSKAGSIFESYVKKELGADGIAEDVAQLLGYVGAEAYRGAGGIVTEDLFGNSHIISDEALLKQMARRALDAECERLKADGWAWAEIEGDLPRGARFWSKSEPKTLKYEGGEEQRLKALRARLAEIEEMDEYDDAVDIERDNLAGDVDSILSAVRSRSFDEKKKKQLGCIVDIENGRLFVLYGVKKPAEAKLPAEAGDEPAKPAKKQSPSTPAEADEEDISQALLHRLSVQKTKAAATALILDEQLALSVLIAGVGCYSNCGVKVSVSGLGSRDHRGLLGAEDMKRALPLAQKLKPAERIALLTQIAANALDFQHTSTDHNDPNDGATAIVDAIDAKAFNAAARGAFDAKDYFNGVSKALNLKAIEEALGPDLARQQAKGGKAEIVAFAIENVPTTGWLPLQLRAKAYDGPPVKRGKIVAPAPAKPATTAEKVKQAKADRETKRNAVVMKRAAAAKKVAKKTAKKRR